jgi:hypothetical protein
MWESDGGTTACAFIPFVLGFGSLFERNHDRAVAEHRRAIELNPSLAVA